MPADAPAFGELRMNHLVPICSPTLPMLAAAGERASMHFLEFFAANMRTPHTRRDLCPGE